MGKQMGRMFIIGLNILGFAWSVGLAALKCSVASLCGQFTGFNFPLLNRTILPLFTGSYGSNDPTLCVTLGSNLQIHCTLVSSDMVEVPLQSSGCTSIGLRSCNSTGFATEQMVSYFLTTRDTPPDFLSTLRIVNPIFGVIKNDSFAVELSPHLEDIDGICLTITEIGEFLVAPNSLSIHALQDGATEPGSWFFEVKPVRKQVNGRQLYGLSSIGYVELIPSTEVFFSERDFHSNGRSDRIEDVDNEMAVWEQNIFQHFSEVTNVARTDKNSLIDICIWTSSVMDGQKRIWLQQAEFLDHSKFSFAWIISLLGNHTVAEAMRSPLDFLLKGSLIAALLEIPDSVMVDSPFNMLSLPVATIADSPAGIDVQLSTSLLESNQSVLFEYVRQRLVIANGTIELTSPPWCRRILEAVKEVLTSLQCDILVYGNNRGFSSDVLITDVARALGIPTVTELLNLFIHPYVMPDVVVAPSHYALNHKSIQTSLLEAKVLPATGVICPAVDFNHFYPRPTSPLVRKDIVMPALIKIGFVARVSVGKNPGLFLQAARLIADAYPAVLFIIIGDGKLRDPMRDLAQRLSLSELVNFRGFIPYHSLPQHLQDIDIIINPSLRAWSETFCIANLEAMAMGIPIVTFAVGGIGEYVNKPPSVEHDVEFVQVGNAVVVNEPSPTALASATLFLISHPEERKQIGIAGRTSILEYFSIARQMKQYAHVYSSIYKYSRGQLSDYTAS